jgi:drug/metabolite transporter (DMT)-like permease
MAESATASSRSLAFSPAVAVAVTVLLWSSSFPGIRAALIGFTPGQLAALRYLVASGVLVLLAVVRRLSLPRRSDLPRIALVGGLGIAAYNLALNTGETTVSAGAASFLINTGPLFTALLAWRFLGERLRPWAVIGFALGFSGVCLIALGGPGGMRFQTGALFVLLAAVCQSAQFVLQKPLLARYGALASTAHMVWAGTLCLLPFLPGALSAISPAPRSALVAVLYLGVFPAAIAYAAWSSALARIEVSRAVTALYLVAPMATILGAVWLHELPAPLALAGGTVAIAGVIVVNTLGKASHAR